MAKLLTRVRTLSVDLAHSKVISEGRAERSEGETFVQSGTRALGKALEDEHIPASQLVRIVAAIRDPSQPFPAAALLMARNLGICTVSGFDICSGEGTNGDAALLADAYLADLTGNGVDNPKGLVALVCEDSQQSVHAEIMQARQASGTAEPKTCYAALSGTGVYLPEKKLNNRTLSRIFARVLTHLSRKDLDKLTPEGIEGRCGIWERRVARRHETLGFMAAQSLEAALKNSGLAPFNLDCIIVATTNPNSPYPSIAKCVAGKLGISYLPAYDLHSACAGFAYGIEVAKNLVQAGMYTAVGVCGVERMREMVDTKSVGESIIFGDGSGAVVVKGSHKPGIIASVAGSDASLAGLITLDGRCIRMDGKKVFTFAVDLIPQIVTSLSNRSGIALYDVDLLVPHQANKRIIEASARALGIPLARVMLNLKMYSNTSAASVPIALHDALNSKRIKAGDSMFLFGFGGGMSYSAHALYL